LKKLSTKQILQKNQEKISPLRDHFILWLHDIRSLHNVGAAFRNADAFGIHQLWLSGFTPTPPRPEITKTAIGAEEHVEWKKVEHEIEAIRSLKKQGYTVLALEQTDQSIPIDQYAVTEKPVCLILGNEVTGVADHLLPEIDTSVEISQFGMKHSLNVSVASGVALYAFYEKYCTSDRLL